MKSRKIAREVLETEAEAIRAVSARLDERFDEAVELILATKGRVVVSGMGKSGIICKKLAATFASTGTPAFFLHPTEACHGDLGMVVEGDLVLVLSASGETLEMLRLLEYVKRIGVTMVALAGNMDSTIARSVDVAIDASVEREACLLNLAPTASTAAAMALGDALAVAVYTRRGFKTDDFARIHPGGRLGAKLVKVGDVMRTGDSVPRVHPDLKVREAVGEMSAKSLGLTTVVDDAGVLVGILTDGDLRRLVEMGLDLAKTDVSEALAQMPRRVEGPVRIDRNDLAVEALKVLEKHRLTALVVTDSSGRLDGIVKIHDLWRLQMF